MIQCDGDTLSADRSEKSTWRGRIVPMKAPHQAFASRGPRVARSLLENVADIVPNSYTIGSKPLIEWLFEMSTAASGNICTLQCELIRQVWAGRRLLDFVVGIKKTAASPKVQ